MYCTNEDLIQDFPDFIQYNASDYEVVYSDFYTEEKSDDISAFMSESSEDVLKRAERIK